MAMDDRGSTASTVSEVFKTALQSPAPICMFYLSHPFGVVSPSVAKDDYKDSISSSPGGADQIVSGDSILNYRSVDGIQRRRRQRLGDENDVNGKGAWERRFAGCNHQRSTTSGLRDDSRIQSGRLIPWPRDTWRREFVVPPLIQFHGREKDQNTAPDLEVILRTIRQAWKSPHPKVNYQSRSYEDTDTPTTEWNIFQPRNFGINFKQHQKKKSDSKYKMGSGNNSTPVISGLLRRRYSVPEIIMRKHSLAQQKAYDESTAATAPSPHRSPGPIYHKSYSTSTPNRSYPVSSGSDSNLTIRRVERGEMSMRKSTLLRRIWSREMKRYDDARSGSWSPPMRRSQRRLHPEPVEMHRCEECRKFEDDHSDDSEELVVGGSRKRLRLISSNGKETLDDSPASCRNTSSNYTRSTSERVVVASTNNNSLESTPSLSTSEVTSSNQRTNNVHIYMTPIQSDQSSSEPADQGQDMLRVEIDLDNSETNGNSIQEEHNSSDENRNVTPKETRTANPTKASTNGNDSPLDRFISKLLIDNLADLAEEINEQFENNNNLMRNSSTPKSKRATSVYVSPDHMKIVVDKCENFDLLSSTKATGLDASTINDLNKSTESSSVERVIYFPSFSLECKDDMSSITSNYSDLEFNGSSSEGLVKVSVGSVYPESGHSESLVIPRMLNKLPRTESLEAQHSLNSAMEEGNEKSAENENDDTDDSGSLVDSLDELQSTSNNHETFAEKTEEASEATKDDEDETASSACREPEAFFISMGNGRSREIQTATVAERMPEKLKQRIIRRQIDLDKKREEEHKIKQKKEGQLMEPKMDGADSSQKSPARMKKESPVKEKPPIPKKSENVVKKKAKASVLRSEIGLLESYTIDSKGNMLFKAPQNKTESSSTGTNTAGSISKKANPNRPPIQRKQSIIGSEPPKIILAPPETKSSTSTSSSKKSKSRTRTDIQKMTIFQAHSDIITPDSENGPRRVYQKTEIQDGEKHIEILEIVECIETSPEYSPDRQQTFRVLTKSSLSRRSKIPIPVYKMGRSCGYQKAIRCPLMREGSPNSIARNLQSSSSNKVDRVIAELLIDALNRPDEVGIEIIKSPKDFSRDRPSSKRQSSHRRSTPRKSANNTKYQQVFEVIPEEKSSFSVDSSAEETAKSSKVKVETDSSSNQVNSTSDQTSSCTAPTKEIRELSISTSTSSKSSSQKLSGNSGRLAVDHAEPNAWIGFFRRHNDSSMEEDESPSKSYPDSSVATSSQPTITTPSTNTAAMGTQTPKDLSSAGCINSAESDNILRLIDKTFEKNGEDLSKPPSSSEKSSKHSSISNATASGATSAVTSETFSNTCKSCKLARKRGTVVKPQIIEKIKQNEPQSPKLNPIRKSDTIVKVELKQSSENSSQSSIASSSTAEANSDPLCSRKKDNLFKNDKVSQSDAWRVQSPDICKMAIPKLKDKDKYEDSPSFTELSTEIDTKSFIIVEENCNASSSRLNGSMNLPLIPPTSTDSINPILANKCTICCFCNPDLHKSTKNASSTPCPYCNRRRTPPKREEETNTESDYFLNHPFYQSMTKSDHTHIRTRSRDSDVVSTKCTKVNEKIKNYNIPEATPGQGTSSKSKGTKNLSRPKNVINLPTRADTKPVHKTVQDTIKSKDCKTKNSSPDKKAFRLPSPYTNLSSTSFERTTSPSSSSDSTCPTTPSRCPVLPPTRRQNLGNGRSKSNEQLDRERKKGKSSDGNGIGATKNAIVPDNVNNNGGSSNGKANGQANGWSVTVAGSYNQDMAPDLEMRLSFPKPGASEGNTQTYYQQSLPSNHTANHIMADRRDIHNQRIINGNSIYAESHYQDEDLVNDNYTRNNIHHPALPAPPGNPKRTLTRIVSERTHSQRDINFPEVTPPLRNASTTRQMAKKAIKHTECSVAVTSATRTISKFTRGRRTISYHTLNTMESQRTNNSSNNHNNRDRHLIRDNSLDLGNLSSGRRMSLESHTPSAADCLTLSIMGNAIAPEQKPRVLTMSEKDLTRRHQSCFTRNRAFFT